MHGPVSVVAATLVSHPNHPANLPTVFAEDWPITPPALSLVVASSRSLRDQHDNTLETLLIVDVWHTDANAAKEAAQQIAHNATHLHHVTTSHGVYISGTLRTLPAMMATTGDPAGTDQRLLRVTSQLEVVTTDA